MAWDSSAKRWPRARDGETRRRGKTRQARALPNGCHRAIAEQLTYRRVRLSLGGSVYDPTDSVGRLLFNELAMVAEFLLFRHAALLTTDVGIAGLMPQVPGTYAGVRVGQILSGRQSPTE